MSCVSAGCCKLYMVGFIIVKWLDRPDAKWNCYLGLAANPMAGVWGLPGSSSFLLKNTDIHVRTVSWVANMNGREAVQLCGQWAVQVGLEEARGGQLWSEVALSCELWLTLLYMLPLLLLNELFLWMSPVSVLLCVNLAAVKFLHQLSWTWSLWYSESALPSNHVREKAHQYYQTISFKSLFLPHGFPGRGKGRWTP